MHSFDFFPFFNSDHNLKIISISSSNTSIGIRWKYNTYDRVQFLQSAQLQIRENGRVTHKVIQKSTIEKTLTRKKLYTFTCSSTLLTKDRNFRDSWPESRKI